MTTATFPIADPIWCAGCGHFGVLAALDGAFDRTGIERHNAMVVAGIGCSGTIQNHLPSYGYHALHGRLLPTAIGAKLVNPELTVIAAGGDGDGLAIGAGHLVHAFRSNPSVTYVLMNNATYGLTKGQVSPTSPAGFKGTTTQRAMDPIALGLAMPGTTFLARGYVGWPEQLQRLMDAAIRHQEAGRGFAFLEIVSPCVAYNDRYQDWPSMLLDVDADADYDAGDRAAAFVLTDRLHGEDRFPAGLIYEAEGVSLERTISSEPAARLDLDSESLRKEYAQVMDGFRG
jgi:2-oxoglutarate/2-oxoacid ferredoxin oxidoreductase subunit beta